MYEELYKTINRLGVVAQKNNVHKEIKQAVSKLQTITNKLKNLKEDEEVDKMRIRMKNLEKELSEKEKEIKRLKEIFGKKQPTVTREKEGSEGDKWFCPRVAGTTRNRATSLSRI